MKNKKGFTLIELLAIIVILAIIAVITVPIILNVIENAKKGSVIDSAYGYKDAVQKYYLTKSVNNTNQELPTGTYNITNLPSDFDVSGEHPTEGCVQLEKGRVTSFTLKFNDYVVTKTNDSEPSAQKGGEIPENSCSIQNGTTVADITVSDYGQYVDLGTNLLDLENITLADNTNPEADWRVFLKDENGAWLILADYLPVGEGTTGASVVSTVGLKKSGTYSVYSTVSREDIVSKLNGDWSGLLAGSDVTGLTVKGTVSLDQWKDSWNANDVDTTLYTKYENPVSGKTFDGWYIGNAPDPTTKYFNLASDKGYDNTLYFPRKSNVSGCNISGCYAYRLASPSADGSGLVVGVGFRGGVGTDGYSNPSYAVRPVVYLPNSIGLDTTNDVWTIVQ